MEPGFPHTVKELVSVVAPGQLWRTTLGGTTYAMFIVMCQEPEGSWLTYGVYASRFGRSGDSQDVEMARWRPEVVTDVRLYELISS